MLLVEPVKVTFKLFKIKIIYIHEYLYIKHEYKLLLTILPLSGCHTPMLQFL